MADIPTIVTPDEAPVVALDETPFGYAPEIRVKGGTVEVPNPADLAMRVGTGRNGPHDVGTHVDSLPKKPVPDFAEDHTPSSRVWHH